MECWRTGTAFVEISFMPKALAAKVQYHAFWYKPIPSPAEGLREMGRADDGVCETPGGSVRDRRGGEWYFEVWNEPNIDFWIGEPAQESYLSFTITPRGH